LPAHEISAHELWVEVRGCGMLIDRVQVAAVEVLAESDGLTGDLLVEVQRGVVENKLRGRALGEDTGPEPADLGSLRQSIGVGCDFALLTSENVTRDCG
jgi:hypothetical protein